MSKQHPIVGNYAPDFELLGTDDHVHHLGGYLKQFKAVAVAFLDHNSSKIGSYLKPLQEVQREFSHQGLLVVGINSQSSLDEMKRFTAQYQLDFPYLRDSNQDVAISFEVMMKPEAFLIDSQGIIRYRGQVDEYSAHENRATSKYFRDNIQVLLN